MPVFNMKDWVYRINCPGHRAALPIMTHPGIEMISRKVLEAVTDGEIQYRAMQALADRYPGAASTMIMDLTVEAEAFGCRVSFPEHDVPAVMTPVAPDYLAVKQLEIPSLQSGRIPEYLKAARLAAQHIHDRPVLGGCIGPFSLAGRLFGLTEIMTASYLEPDTITLLIEKCTAFLMAYVLGMKKSGLNGIIMAEPAAGLLDEELCDQFSTAYIRHVVERVQDDHFLFILHNCGNTGQVTRSMVQTGARGLHLGNRIDIHQALREIPDTRLVLGNLDPVGAFKMATPEAMKQLTLNLLISTSGHPNFVLSSGCDTPPGVPEANIGAFFEAIQEFNTLSVS
jgi:uroporphyrinogen decarboxylase